MLRYIESLRKSPLHARNRYSAYGAIGITGIIMMFWLVSLPSKFAATPVDTDNDSSGGIARALEDVKAQLAQVGGVFEDSKDNLETIATTSSDSSGEYELDMEAVFNANNSTSSPVSDTPSVSSRTVLIATTSSEKASISPQ